MEKKISYTESNTSSQSSDGINQQIFQDQQQQQQQQPCIGTFNLSNDGQHQERLIKFETAYNMKQQQEFTTTASQSSYSTCDQFSLRPTFHSPQINTFSKCSYSQAKIQYSPFDSFSLQSHSAFTSPILQSSSYPPFQLKNNKFQQQNTETLTPCVSNFDIQQLRSPYIGPTLFSSSSNNNKMDNLQGQISKTYFQHGSFSNPYPQKYGQPNYNNKYKQNQQFNNNSVNHYLQSPIQSMKQKLRKQSFNSSSNNSTDDSSNYQFRARAGSYASTIKTNHFNHIPAKTKQIEEKFFRKQKRPIKHPLKQYCQQSNQKYDENEHEQINVLNQEEMHDFDNNRITNEDLIATHQESMKEEQFFQSKENEFQTQEKEEDQDNLDELNLIHIHEQNYGCSMIDKIIDEQSNDDETKGEKTSCSQQTNNNLFKTSNQDDLGQNPFQQIEQNNMIQNKDKIQNEDTKNIYDFHEINNEDWQKNSIIQWVNNTKQKLSYQEREEEENSKTNEYFNDNDLIIQNKHSQQSVKMNEETIDKQNDLNKLLNFANENIENPQALYDIVQQLAQQIREKDKTIKSMELDNHQQSIKSLSSIQQEQDNKFINSGLFKLTLTEKISIDNDLS